MNDLNHKQFESTFVHYMLNDVEFMNDFGDYIKKKYFAEHLLGANPACYTVLKIVRDAYSLTGELPNMEYIVNHIPEYNRHSDETSKGEECLKAIEAASRADTDMNRELLYRDTTAFLQERATLYRAFKIGEDISANKLDTGKNLHDLELIHDIKPKTDESPIFFLKRDINDLQDLLEETNSHISSTWSWLDKQLGGGFLQNDKSLTVFSGQSNVGKSAFLGSVSCNIAKQGYNVLLVTLEMSRTKYVRNLTAHFSNIEPRELVDNKDKYVASVSDIKGEIIVVELPTSETTTNHIKTIIKRLDFSIDVIVVDYLSLMQPNKGMRKNDMSYERTKYIAEELRDLSGNLKLPVITAHQFNREGYNKDKPNLTHNSGSLGLGNTADTIIAISRTEEDIENGFVRLTSLKSRETMPRDSQIMNADYAHINFTPVSTTEEKALLDSVEDEPAKPKDISVSVEDRVNNPLQELNTIRSIEDKKMDDLINTL